MKKSADFFKAWPFQKCNTKKNTLEKKTKLRILELLIRVFFSNLRVNVKRTLFIAETNILDKLISLLKNLIKVLFVSLLKGRGNE